MDKQLNKKNIQFTFLGKPNLGMHNGSIILNSNKVPYIESRISIFPTDHIKTSINNNTYILKITNNNYFIIMDENGRKLKNFRN